MTALLCLLYLGAIVAANLLVTRFGPAVVPVNAFVLIGLDLTARDALHDAWQRNRWRNMAALVLAGSLLSYLLNADAARIAMASAVAFGAAGLVDTAVYHLARRRSWLERVNVSNLASALVDSILFPTLAFGVFSWQLTLAQFTAKVAGGVVWGLVLDRARPRAVAAPA